MKYTVTLEVEAADEETAAFLIKNEATMLGPGHVMPVYPERLIALRSELREIGDEVEGLNKRIQEVATQYENVPCIDQFVTPLFAALQQADECDFEIEIDEEMVQAVAAMEQEDQEDRELGRAAMAAV